MKERFISAVGPGQAPLEPDVRYRTSRLEFADALAARTALNAQLDSEFTTVIYRLSYDADADEFYSSRQTRYDIKGGNQRFDPREPADLAPLGYELFTTPTSLLGNDEDVLTEQVQRIFTHSHTGRPGKAGPGG